MTVGLNVLLFGVILLFLYVLPYCSIQFHDSLLEKFSPLGLRICLVMRLGRRIVMVVSRPATVTMSSSLQKLAEGYQKVQSQRDVRPFYHVK